MITAEEPVFPINIGQLMKLRFQMIDSDLSIFMRPLRTSDPNQSIAILPMQVTPDEDSHEMRGMGNIGPTVSQYAVGIQALVKDADEPRGLAVHSVLARRIRSTLDRDPALRVGLASLSTTDDFGAVERSTRWGVRTQRYMSNELEGAFLHLSTTEFYLETETT